MSRTLATEGIAVDKIRVVLADDHREVIAKIRGVLGDEFEVVEAVVNGIQAVSAVLALDPDVFRDRYFDASLERAPGCKTYPERESPSQDHIRDYSRRSGFYRCGVFGRSHGLCYQAPPLDRLGLCNSGGAERQRFCV